MCLIPYFKWYIFKCEKIEFCVWYVYLFFSTFSNNTVPLISLMRMRETVLAISFFLFFFFPASFSHLHLPFLPIQQWGEEQKQWRWRERKRWGEVIRDRIEEKVERERERERENAPLGAVSQLSNLWVSQFSIYLQ